MDGTSEAEKNNTDPFLQSLAPAKPARHHPYKHALVVRGVGSHVCAETPLLSPNGRAKLTNEDYGFSFGGKIFQEVKPLCKVIFEVRCRCLTLLVLPYLR